MDILYFDTDVAEVSGAWPAKFSPKIYQQCFHFGGHVPGKLDELPMLGRFVIVGAAQPLTGGHC